MSEPQSGFVDTNVLLQLFSTDDSKADRASALVEDEPVLSVQVLSDFTAVARRKWQVDWTKIDDIVATVLDLCRVEALALGTCRDARRLAARYRLTWDVAMIAASALSAGCTRSYPEDVQYGEALDRKLRPVNPFV